ncbi:hypothetical protein AB0J74_18325 [Asanoa sp. NPDC049573]|uniref:hypothetical protein n=1 Tax=Asanoa sp. NPDC049573 TaxID=3155396 RepID=UPI0034418761
MTIAARSLVYCAVLLPLSVAALVAVLLGRQGAALAWWRALRVRWLGRPPVPPRRPRTVLVLGHAVASFVLGLIAVVPLGVQVLWVLRGVLYGFVDRGPYDHSWGGPSRAGAWLAHFLIGTPEALAGLAALAGIAALHQRLTASLDGVRAPRWLFPTVALAVLAMVLLFVAWTRQL